MLVASLAIALLAPVAARAGFVVGARVAWAIPGGDLTEGVDFAWGALAIGPYATFGVGRYTVVDVDLADVGGPTLEIGDPANHRWVQLGLRGTFGR